MKNYIRICCLNAVKYTPPKGHILLTVRDRLDNVATEISDSGIGIPKNELARVFDEFYRASNVPKDIKSGSGLGLSIVRQIVDNHKGKISVSSEPGVWTKFTFILPKDPTKISYQTSVEKNIRKISKEPESEISIIIF